MSKCIIVLGMHRSATSLIAKSLSLAGVNMGNSMLPADAGNPEGYYEDSDFLNMNKFLLASAGGSWDHPPLKRKIAELANDKYITEEIKKLIETKSAPGKLWGWKEPRTVLTIRLYHKHLKDPIYITAHRKVAAIARSLALRNGINNSQATALAVEYNKRLTSFLNDIGHK